jgi:hypothetical protein
MIVHPNHNEKQGGKVTIANNNPFFFQFKGGVLFFIFLKNHFLLIMGVIFFILCYWMWKEKNYIYIYIYIECQAVKVGQSFFFAFFSFHFCDVINFITLICIQVPRLSKPMWHDHFVSSITLTSILMHQSHSSKLT